MGPGDLAQAARGGPHRADLDGRDARGLPADIQLMGRPRADLDVLALGHIYETAGA